MCRNITDSYLLTLCPATLLNLLALTGFFKIGFSIPKIMSSGNIVLLYSFQFYMPLISSSCLIALARASRTVLDRSSKRGHLVPDLRKKLSMSCRWVWVGCVFIHGLYHVDEVSAPSFLSVIVMKRC